MATKNLLLVGHPGRLIPAGQTVLEREDVRHEAAKNATEALARIDDREVDLVLIGGDLEDSSAVDVCRQIRERKIRQPSIVLVASPLEETRIAQAREAGANAVLHRPVDPAEFDQVIGRLLTVPTRQAFRVLVRVRTEAGGSFFGESRNLSTTGLLVDTAGELLVGTPVEIRFYLPGDRREIAVHAEVARQGHVSPQGCSYGLRFHELAEDDRQAIAAFVERKRRST